MNHLPQALRQGINKLEGSGYRVVRVAPNPPAIKEHLLREKILPVHGGDAGRYIAIESNPRSREMYARFGITSFWVAGEGTCLTEGTRIVKRLPR